MARDISSWGALKETARPARARQQARGDRLPRNERNMLDSVRIRITVWYSAVLALVLVLVSATTYLIVRNTSMQRTDAELAVLADSFVVTFEDELADEAATGASAVV